MAATLGLFAKGAKLYRKDPLTLIYAHIIQARTLAAPEINQEYADISNHDSPSNFREFIDTFRDGGELTMEIVWNPAISLHAQLYNDALDQTVITWKLVLNNASSSQWIFTARVSKFSVPLPHDAAIFTPFSLKVTSNPAFTA